MTTTKELVHIAELTHRVTELIERKATDISIQDDRGNSGCFVVIHDAPLLVDDYTFATNLERRLFKALINLAEHVDNDCPVSCRTHHLINALGEAEDVTYDVWAKIKGEGK
jgi:hypothetical protein